MGVRQYIGARYVPKYFEGEGSVWTPNTIYEPLTIVVYNSRTYTSKTTVPATVGNPSANPDYWVANPDFNQNIQEIVEQLNALEANTESFESVENYRKVNMVLIGDSYLEGYTPDGNVTGWGDLLTTYLGLGDTQTATSVKKYQGGSGIAAPSNNKRFVDLASEVVASMSQSDRDAITHVIVAGGVNDVNTSHSQIIQYGTTLANTLKSGFVNAKIIFVFVGRSGSTNYADRIYSITGSWRQCATSNSVKFVDGSTWLFQNNCISSDGLHPNQNGQNLIAQMIADAMYGYESEIRFKGALTVTGATDVSKVMATHDYSIVGDITTFRFGGDLEFSSDQTLGYAQWLNIGTYELADGRTLSHDIVIWTGFCLIHDSTNTPQWTPASMSIALRANGNIDIRVMYRASSNFDKFVIPEQYCQIETLTKMG